MSKRVLCILFPGFEEIEAVTPIDLLRRAGAEVKLASISAGKNVTGRSNLTFMADATLSEVTGEEFDLLLIPGGPGVAALRADGRAAKLARRFANDRKIVAAICAAPTVLADAGLLAKARFTAHVSTLKDLPQALTNERVVEDGNLITSRGAGTAVDFGLALVRRLYGDATAAEISEAIMA